MTDDLAQPNPRLSPEAIERWRNQPPSAAKTEFELRIEATMDALLEQSRIANSEWQEDYLRQALADAQWMVNAHKRAAKKRKAEAAAAMDDVDGRDRAVVAACILAGRRPAKTPKCLDSIRQFLPEEHRRATVRQLYASLGKAKERITKKR
jgi:hypothetical protein